jgi:exodeoxyribonuclease VII large subunit
VHQVRARIGVRLTHLLAAEIDRIGHLRSRPSLASSGWIVDSRAEELTRFVSRGAELMERAIDRESTRTAELRGQLRALSPQGTLDRGYAIVQLPSGAVLRAPGEAPAGTRLKVTVAGGALGAVSDSAVDQDDK